MGKKSHTEGYTKSPREQLRSAVRIWQARRAADAIVARTKGGAGNGRVLVIPGDWREPSGSRGDEALLAGTWHALCENLPDTRVALATAPDAPVDLAYGYDIVAKWRGPGKVGHFLEEVSAYSWVVVIGADMMDGYYSGFTSVLRFIIADMIGRLRGRDHAVVVGFSFNARPDRAVRGYLSRQAPAASIFLRDPVSLKRYDAIAKEPANLSADIAFLMTPVEPPRATIEALERIRAERTLIVGMNVHPMLSAARDEDAIAAIATRAAEAIDRLADEHGAGVVLIPHDLRKAPNGDVDMLRDVVSRVRRKDACYLIEDVLSAAQIKGLMTFFDFVVSGRMHLTIAALGSGVPVLGITYQGKFDGLFLQHFELPDDTLVSAEDVATNNGLLGPLTACLGNLNALRAQVAVRAGPVREAAARNLRSLRRATR